MQKPCKKMANGNYKVKAIFMRGTHSAGNLSLFIIYSGENHSEIYL